MTCPECGGELVRVTTPLHTWFHQCTDCDYTWESETMKKKRLQIVRDVFASATDKEVESFIDKIKNNKDHKH